MKKNKYEVVCTTCQGTGEEVIEQGEFGYAPIKDTCLDCNGKGYMDINTDEVYDADAM